MARILVIDDSVDSLDLMQFLLKAFGHEVFAAHGGEEGLALAQEKMPDLILCDIHMPVVDGFAVIERLHRDANLRLIPCIAVTALAMIGDKSVIMNAGFDGYISKPIDPEKFVGDIEVFLKSKKLKTE